MNGGRHEEASGLDKRPESVRSSDLGIRAERSALSRRVSGTIARMTGSEHGFHAWVEDDGTVLVIHAGAGDAMADRPCVEPLRLPLQRARWWGQAVERRRPVIVNEDGVDLGETVGLPAGELRVDRLLIVPFSEHGIVTSVAAAAGRSLDYTGGDATSLAAFLGFVDSVARELPSDEILRASERERRRILRRTRQMGLSLDVEGRITLANEPFLHLTGWREDEILGRDWVDLFVPQESRGRVRSVFDSMFRSTTPHGTSSCETDVLTRRGERRRVVWSCISTGDSHGDGGDAIALGVDVTDQRRAEQALRERDDILSKAEALSGSGAWKLDMASKRSLISENLRKIAGVTSKALSWEEFTSIVPPEELPRVLQALQDALDGTARYDLQHALVRQSDGRRVIIHSRGEVVRDDQGKPLHVYGVAYDVTEQLERDRALRQIEWMLSPDESASKPGVVEPSYGDITTAGTVHEIRDALGSGPLRELVHGFLDLMGTSAAVYEKNGDYAVGIFSSRWCRRLDEASRALCETEDNREALACGRWHCHEACWRKASQPCIERRVAVDVACMGGIRIHSVPIFAGDDVVGAINFGYGTPPCDDASLRVISKLYRISVPELRELAAGYEVRPPFIVHVARERLVTTAKLIGEAVLRRRAECEQSRLQAQLAQAQKLESIGRLAGGVAHDFNNMLGVILGHCELLLADLPVDSPLFDELDQVRKAAQRSADLTRQLLAFARKQAASPRVLDLNETIGSMLRMLERLIGEDIVLHWRPADDLETVLIDPAQVDQVLANLVVNARDAIGGLGTVTIETGMACIEEGDLSRRAECAPGRYLVLSISDTGCGMDERTRDRIFDPFFSTKGLGDGTGLGLATIYGIVKQNDGGITVDSELGRGTTFRIYLPAFRQERLPGSGEEEAAANGKQTGQETILLVEDEPAILAIGIKLLERMGYEVIAATGPRAAIRVAQERLGEIHLILTDIIMPEMNGRDLAERVRALHPRIKTLYMSGYTADVIADRGVLDDGVHLLEKPFSSATLAKAVREALDEPGPAPSTIPPNGGAAPVR